MSRVWQGIHLAGQDERSSRRRACGWQLPLPRREVWQGLHVLKQANVPLLQELQPQH